MTQTLCDICGKPIVRHGRTFMIKECKGLFDGFFWQTLDAHDECVKMLVQAKRERRADGLTQEGPDR